MSRRGDRPLSPLAGRVTADTLKALADHVQRSMRPQLIGRSESFIARAPRFVALRSARRSNQRTKLSCFLRGGQMINRRRLVSRLGLFAALTACGLPAIGQEAPQQAPASKVGRIYVCPPCGCGKDKHEFDAPGACPDCGMPLVEKAQPAPPQTSSPSTPSASPTDSKDASSATRDAKQPASPTQPQ